MEATRRQKTHNAICTAIAYAAKAFLTIGAAAFGLMFLVCLTQLFREPAISLIGALGFGFGAWVLWETRKDIITR